MQQLYNQLVTGTIEYKENGEQVNHPPSPLMLRAARTIQELVGITNNNNTLIQQLQQREHDSTQAEMRYQDQQRYLEEVIRNLSQQLKESNESLCKSEREVSNVGDATRVDAGAVDPGSEGGTTGQDDGLGTN